MLTSNAKYDLSYCIYCDRDRINTHVQVTIVNGPRKQYMLLTNDKVSHAKNSKMEFQIIKSIDPTF